MNLIQSLDEIYNSKNDMKNAFINIGVNATGDLSSYARYIENLSPSSSFNGMLQFNNEEEMLNYNTPIVGDICVLYDNINNSFGGLYQYNNGWEIAPTQLTVNDLDVISGTYYGANGVSSNSISTPIIINNGEDYNSKNILYNRMNQINKILTSADTSNATNLYSLFTYSGKYMEISPKLNTINTTNMTEMFATCYNLKYVFPFNSSGVVSMNSMFTSCNNLLWIPNLDMKNVTDCAFMFNNCSNLVTIPKLNTANVRNAIFMFNGCYNLRYIPDMDFSNLNSAWGMFQNCNRLEYVSTLNTINLTNMENMFYNCSNLTTIRGLDTNNVKSMFGTFYNCINLISLPELNTINVTNFLIVNR